MKVVSPKNYFYDAPAIYRKTNCIESCPESLVQKKKKNTKSRLICYHCNTICTVIWFFKMIYVVVITVFKTIEHNMFILCIGFWKDADH